MIINIGTLTTLFTAFSAAFQGAFDQAQVDWDKVATQVPSGTETNLYAFLGQFPKMREWIGDRQIKNLAAHSYSIINKPFESTVAVPKTKIEDNQYGTFSTLFADMGYAAKTHPDEVIFALLAAGASTPCYDGQYFFDTDHVHNGTTTVANYDATGAGNLWVLMDTRRPLKPLIWQKRQDYNFQSFTSPSDEHVFRRNEFLYGVDARANAGFGLWQMAYGSLNTLNDTNFNAYVATMMALKSDEGRPLGIRPNLLVCGPANRAAARSLIETQFLSSGASNPNYKAVDVLVTPYLT